MDNSVVKMRGICKSFPGVLAVNEVNLELECGKIHALVGENGAGKSTLVKLLTGVYSIDKGEILIKGQPAKIDSPYTAEEFGIICIHQEPALVPHLDVGTNILLGREPTNFLGVVDKKELYILAKEKLNELGVSIDPKAIVSNISIGEQQMVGICRALARSPIVFILDEPTAALTNSEVAKLFELLRNLKNKGVCILYISHRMEEIFELADTVTVMRDGKKISSLEIKDTSTEEIVRLMIGKKLQDFYPKEQITFGKELLKVENLSTETESIKNINITVRAGEIVGIYGLVGAGQTDLVYSLIGAKNIKDGKIFFEGKQININSPSSAINQGIALVSRERRLEGLVLRMSVRENISLAVLKKWSSYGFINFSEEKSNSQKFIDLLNIRTPSQEQEVQYLSGGNQQKVVIAKWLANNSKLLICDEPTRGVDVGAKIEIYSILTELLKQGTGILFISSELQEVMSLSDRIIVMYRGKIVLDKPTNQVTSDQLLSYALVGELVENLEHS